MNLETEVRRGYTIPAEMKSVWKVQMDLLKKLLDVCQKHNLQIWAEGGTLLGTVREHGYIPWDDDIDMVMFRDDYDELVRIAATEFPPPYFFQCGYTEKIYPRGHAQLRMDGTTAILPYTAFINTHQGIFIDIFILDGVPVSPVKIQELVSERDKRFKRMQSIASFNILHPLRSLYFRRYRSSFQQEFKAFEDVLRTYPVKDNEEVGLLSFCTDMGHFLRKKEWYGSTLYMPFEDLEMPVPCGYHEILTKQYGDYQTPRQVGTYHGGYWKLDAGIPYQTYLPELKQYYREIQRKNLPRRIKAILKRIIHI